MQSPQSSAEDLPELLSVLINHTPTAIAILDRDLGYRLASRRWRQMHGLGDRPLLGEKHDVLFADLAEQWHWIRQQCLAGIAESWEEAIPGQTGPVEWLRWSARPWHTSHGEIGGLVLSTEVITACKQSHEERDRFFTLSPDMLCILGFDGYFKHLNPSWERVLGHTTSLFLSQPWLHWVHPEEQEATEAIARLLYQGDQIRSFENRYYCRDGSYRWLSWVASPCAETGLIYATVRDITELKQSEVDLQQTQRFFESVLNHLPVAVVAKDVQELRYALWNPAAETIFQRTAATILGQTDYAWLPKAQADLATMRDREAIQNRREVILPAEATQTDRGDIQILSIKKTVILDTDNTPQYLLAITEDITDRKQAESRLKEQEQFLRSIFDGVDYQIFVTDVEEDGEFHCAGWNRVVERVIGLSADSALGLTPELLFGQMEGAAVRQRFQDCVTAGTAITYEECMTFQQQETWWLTTLTPLRSREGRIYRLVGTAFEISDRKRAEQALRENQQFIQRIADSTPGMLYIYDLENQHTIYTNRNLAEMLGYSAAEWERGKINGEFPFLALLHPEDQAHILVHQQEVRSLVDGEIRELEYRMCNGRGLWTWFQSRETVFKRDMNGHVIQIVGNAQDITARKTAEAALMQSQQRLSLLIQQTPLAVIEWTPQAEVRAWNPSAERIFGYSEAEVIGQHFSFLIDASLQDHVAQIFQDLLTQSGGTRSINPNRTKEGREIICEWYNTPLVAAHGETIGMASLAMDVTEREAAEAALQEREERLRSINTSVPGAIYQFQVNLETGDDRFTYLSPRAVELYEIEPQVLLDHPELMWSMVHPDDLERLQQGIAAVVQQKISSWFDEYRLITPSGQVKWVRAQAEVGFVPDKFSIHNGVIIDISARKAAEAALQQSEAELRQTLAELQQTQARMIQTEKMSSLGQLVAGVAHEINNPVNFIYGNLTHAREYTTDLLRIINLYRMHYPHPLPEIQAEVNLVDLTFIAEDLPKLLNSMKVGADRIRGIVASLRTFSRMDEVAKKDIDIHEGIDSTLVILQSRLRSKDERPSIDVIKHYGDLPLVECYAGQLNQVFMNIFSNAIDALEDTYRRQANFMPRITIETNLLRFNRVRIAIADNGSGMPEHVRTRIFDPFFTTKPVGKGTGMGLSISYQIVTEHHGGMLECHSEPGRGTTFVIQIPLRQRPIKAPAKEEP